MKNTIRVRKNRSASLSTQQVKILAEPALSIVNKANESLALMAKLGDSAGALAMMNAAQIKTDSKECGGWESLDVTGFGQGITGIRAHCG